MKKFIGIKDSELFHLWKENHPDAESEFIERYRHHSYDLAERLLIEFKNVTKAEIDDLMNVGLYAMFIALNSYRGHGSFIAYWEKIAEHKMMNEIKENSYSYQNKIKDKHIPFVSYNDDILFFESSGVPHEKTFIRNDLINLLEDKSLKIKPEDRRLFLLYVDGYSIAELSLMFDMSYNTIRYKIKKIKDKVHDILFNS